MRFQVEKVWEGCAVSLLHLWTEPALDLVGTDYFLKKYKLTK